ALEREPGRRKLHMTEIIQFRFTRNSAETTPQRAKRRDAPVTCASCGRQVDRRGRRQIYCSTRCRKRGHYARSVRKGDFSRPLMTDTALGTTPLQKDNKYNALQRAKTLSSNRIFGPADVLDAEVFNRHWQPAASSGGVMLQVSRVRARALVEREIRG